MGFSGICMRIYRSRLLENFSPFSLISNSAQIKAIPMNQALQSVRVLAAVIRRDDSWLLGLRPSQKRHGGLWEFPGGKYEMGETVLDVATRELFEELAVDVVRVGEILFRSGDPGSAFVIEFTEVSIDGVPIAVEHEAIGWFSLDEMMDLDMAPSDRLFSEFLRGLNG